MGFNWGFKGLKTFFSHIVVTEVLVTSDCKWHLTIS